MSGKAPIRNENPLLRHSDDRREEEYPRLQGDFSVAALPRNDVGEIVLILSAWISSSCVICVLFTEGGRDYGAGASPHHFHSPSSCTTR